MLEKILNRYLLKKLAETLIKEYRCPEKMLVVQYKQSKGKIELYINYFRGEDKLQNPKKVYEIYESEAFWRLTHFDECKEEFFQGIEKTFKIKIRR